MLQLRLTATLRRFAICDCVRRNWKPPGHRPPTAGGGVRLSEKDFGPRAKARVFALIGAIALAGGSVGLAACGDDDEDDGGGQPPTGGEITIAQTSQPDFLDPALSYTVNGWEPMWLVYTPLLTYAHEEGEAGAELIPGLAEDLPEVSEDGHDLHVPAARRPRRTRTARRSWPRDFERTIQRDPQPRVGRRAVLPGHRRRRGVPRRRRRRGGHRGHRDRRRDRRDHDRAGRAGRDVLERRGDELRRPRSRRHPVREPDRVPAAGRRPLRAHRVGPEPAVRDGEGRRVRRPRHPGHPDGATSTRSRP